MEIGPVVRSSPTNAGSTSRLMQSGPEVAVGTTLSDAAVEQAASAHKSNEDPARKPAMASADSVDRKIKIDPATQQVIYETVDRQSGQVVRQVPEEAILRLQVYARAMRRAEANVRGHDLSKSA